MIAPGLAPVVVPITPYERIFDALRADEIDVGLIIHEGRLTYEEEGFVGIVDLGVWWEEQHGLPLPLGGNCIRRSLDPTVKSDVSEILRAGIAHGLEHRELAIDWLLSRGSHLPNRDAVRQYLGMYANERTLEYGEAGRGGITKLFTEATRMALLPPFTPDFL
jgi:1,4-dihydroxy-6-naphthoate synthase